MLDSETISSRTPLTDCRSVSLSKGAHSISIAKLDARRPSADYKQLVARGPPTETSSGMLICVIVPKLTIAGASLTPPAGRHMPDDAKLL